MLGAVGYSRNVAWLHGDESVLPERRRGRARLRVAALIRWPGIRLWLRRLPVVRRRQHRAPEGMA